MTKIIFIQPSLPSYRIDFYKKLYLMTDKKLNVYYSPGELGVLTNETKTYSWALKIGERVRILPGLEWQKSALKVPLKSGDILIVSGGPRCITNMLLLLRARLLGVQVIWWGHLWSSTTKKHRFYLRLLLMKLADKLLFYTDKEVQEYLENYGRNDKRPITALNNGININPIISLRTSYIPEDRGRTILFISRLTKKAKLDLLLHALTTPDLADVTLHIIGSGSEEKSLKQLSTKLCLDKQVQWHQGTTDEKEIAKIANQCSIFVYPGSVGLSLIHAMAYGLPAIVHDSRHHQGPEIAAFENQVTGKSFDYGSVESLAQTINTLLDDKKRLTQMSLKSKKAVETQFNTQSMANRFFNFISSETRECI